jgi:hypothetical protein
MDDLRDEERAGAFKSVLLRVMLVQVVTLLLLWVLQARYSAG